GVPSNTPPSSTKDAVNRYLRFKAYGFLLDIGVVTVGSDRLFGVRDPNSRLLCDTTEPLHPLEMHILSRRSVQ
ncbi:MAG: hypothetical protein ACI9EZ_000973, partial [Halobacteriales archaeon]